MAIRIVFFDCDGTLTTVKSSWEYLHRRLGLWDENADHFQRLFLERKIDYYEFCRRDAALWTGLTIDHVMAIIDEIPYHEGVREVVDLLKKQGIMTVILSTGLSFLVERVRSDLGVDKAISNHLLVQEGLLTGRIRIDIEQDNKGFWVKRILEDARLSPEEAAAVGDGEGDKGMFESVGLRIGYHPQDKILPFLDHVISDDGSFEEVGSILRAHW
jgi:phosphoserine phosphatase